MHCIVRKRTCERLRGGSAPGYATRSSVLRDISGDWKPAVAASSRTIINMSWCQERAACGVRRAACGVRARHSTRSTGESAAAACVCSSSRTWPVPAALAARSSRRTTHTPPTAAIGRITCTKSWVHDMAERMPPKARTAAAASTAASTVLPGEPGRPDASVGRLAAGQLRWHRSEAAMGRGRDHGRRNFAMVALNFGMVATQNRKNKPSSEEINISRPMSILTDADALGLGKPVT